MTTKKIVGTVLLFLLITCIPAVAQEQSTKKYANDLGVEDSPISYANFPVLKVMETTNAFVVMYIRTGIKLDKCVIPKSWENGNIDNPRKLEVRILQPSLKPYMTYITKDGSFYKVILTLPYSKNDSTWGVAKPKDKISDDQLSKDSLELN